LELGKNRRTHYGITGSSWWLSGKYFNAETMTYCVLGVLMVAPEHTLLQHLVWLRKRIAVGGFEVKGALACSASLGPGQVGGRFGAGRALF